MSGLATFSSDTLITKPGSREEALRAVTAVLRRVPDPADQRTIIAKLFAEARRTPPRGFKGRSPRDESTMKPCGTEAAYQRHKARGEDCAPCLAAANEARAQSAQRVRARRKAAAEAAAKAAS